MRIDRIFDNSLDFIEKRLELHKRELKKCPDGTLWIEKRNGETLYFHVTVNGERKNRRLINRYPEIVSALARKGFLEKEIEIYERDLQAICEARQQLAAKYVEPTVANVLVALNSSGHRKAYCEYYKECADVTGDLPIDVSRYPYEVIEWANSVYQKSEYGL